MLVALLLPAAPASAVQCGVWRWNVKTLSDSNASDVDFSPVAKSVDYLRRLPAPPSLSIDEPRIHPVEFITYKVKAQVVEATVEDDHDVHLVIAPRHHRSHTMIVEFPDTQCNGANHSIKKHAMKHARADLIATCGTIPSSEFVDLKGKVTIKGVGFWDEDHGQTGVAPNAIELHPILSFAGDCHRV